MIPAELLHRKAVAVGLQPPALPEKVRALVDLIARLVIGGARALEGHIPVLDLIQIIHIPDP